MNEIKPLTSFNDEDIAILSNAMICLIDSTNKALKYTYDPDSLGALQRAVEKIYQP